MALVRHTINLRDVAEVRHNSTIVGRCYAFRYEPMREQTRSEGISIHEILLREIVTSLWEAHPNFSVLVFYEVFSQIIRLFVCALRKLSAGFFNCVHPRLSSINGYIESGRDYTTLQNMRPLVLWEPPCTMVALWPPGFEGEIQGNRVLDTGCLLCYLSYEDEDGYRRIKEGILKNPEYLCVPSNSESELTYNGKTYRYLNRFYEIVA